MTPATPATPVTRRDRPWLRQLALLVALAATGAMSYFGAAYQAGRRLTRRAAEIDRTYERIAALGEAAADAMGRSSPEDLPYLEDACRGKLPVGSASSILGYVAALPPDVKTNLDIFLSQRPPPYDLPHEQIVPSRVVAGSVDPHVALLAIEPAHKGLEHRPSATEAMWMLIHDDPSPLNWGGHVAVESRRGPDVLSAKHLVVSVVRAAMPPTLQNRLPNVPPGLEGYRGGIAVIQARVLSVETGATECEGKVEAWMPEWVNSATLPGGPYADPSSIAGAFDQTVAFGALAMICGTGGEGLCAETGRKVWSARPDDSRHP